MALSKRDTGMETMSDDQSAGLARQGSEEAFSCLVQRCVPMVKHQAGAFRGSEVEAEDLVQEGLLGLLSAVKTYRSEGGASFRTYAGVCIRRRMLSAVKRAGGVKMIPTSELVRMDDEENEEPLSIAGGGDDPASLVVEKETVEHLYARLRETLSAREYDVLMQYMGGYSYEEIARRLQSPSKAVDNAMQRVRRKLAAKGLSLV